jgi:hypothetical protein
MVDAGCLKSRLSGRFFYGDFNQFKNRPFYPLYDYGHILILPYGGLLICN